MGAPLTIEWGGGYLCCRTGKDGCSRMGLRGRGTFTQKMLLIKKSTFFPQLKQKDFQRHVGEGGGVGETSFPAAPLTSLGKIKSVSWSAHVQQPQSSMLSTEFINRMRIEYSQSSAGEERTGDALFVNWYMEEDLKHSGSGHTLGVERGDLEYCSWSFFFFSWRQGDTESNVLQDKGAP